MSIYKPSARTEIQRQRKNLDDLLDRARAAEDIDVRADLAKLACLRLSGFLEQALLELGVDLVRRLSSGAPQSFSLSYLDKSFNPRSEAILAYVARFDTTWHHELETLLSRPEVGQQINALIGIRNQIAHGKNQSIGVQQVVEYRSAVDGLIDFLATKFTK